MNSFENFVLKQKVWVHILLSLLTYGIWLIILIVVYVKNSNYPTTSTNNKIETKSNVIKAPLYEKRFVVDDSESYQQNIDKIVELEKQDMTLYEGMTNSEIKECGYEVYEIEGESTPEIILRENKGSSVHYISVQMYHSEFDKYLTIGKIPQSEQEEILKLFDKKIMIWGSFEGGNYKIEEDGRIKTYKEPVSVRLHIKIVEK